MGAGAGVDACQAMPRMRRASAVGGVLGEVAVDAEDDLCGSVMEMEAFAVGGFGGPSLRGRRSGRGEGCAGDFSAEGDELRMAAVRAVRGDGRDSRGGGQRALGGSAA